MLRTEYLYLVTGAMLSFYCFQLLKPDSQKMHAVSCITVYRECRNAMGRSLPFPPLSQIISCCRNANLHRKEEIQE